MGRPHWIGMIVIIVIAYLVGTKYPSYGNAALSKVGL
jgi:hypothetical protein